MAHGVHHDRFWAMDIFKSLVDIPWQNWTELVSYEYVQTNVTIHTIATELKWSF